MEDSAIVELYWQRSERAISESDLKYGKYCRRVAWNICRNDEDTEECINDTWFSAWNQMPDRRPKNLGSFLSIICRNLALNRVEGRRRKKRGGGQTELALNELEECIPAGGGVEEKLELKELMSAIDSFVSGLGRDDRRIFIARYWFLASTAEIAERLGFSQGRVRTSLYRSRQKLQEYLREEGLYEQ
ncbi:MAG: RNA polymerase sigma factor [Candidatus Limivicinus sp.]|jgi:RNA polymerase sigma factor (sigma-70 family)